MHENLRQYLTPAASQMLAELERDFSERLLLGAANAASQAAPELREISVADLARSYERLQPDSSRWRISLIGRVLDAYGALGVLLGLGGLVLSIVHLKEAGSRSIQEPWQFTIASVGFGLLAISWMFGRSRFLHALFERAARRDATVYSGVPFDRTAALIRAWSELEVVLRELAAQRLGESAAQRPVAELIAVLQKGGILSADDVGTLRHYAQIRNRVAHAQDPQVRDLPGVIADLRSFTHRLSARLGTTPTAP